MGIRDVSKYIEDRLSIDILEDDDQRDMLTLFVEIRNIHVHNRGIVNNIFLSRVKTGAALGKIYHVDFDEFAKLNNNALSTVHVLDQSVAEKFGLRRRKFSVWTNDKRITLSEV